MISRTEYEALQPDAQEFYDALLSIDYDAYSMSDAEYRNQQQTYTRVVQWQMTEETGTEWHFHVLFGLSIVGLTATTNSGEVKTRDIPRDGIVWQKTLDFVFGLVQRDTA